ncbi:exo 1,3/1,4-beta-D-glucan glucohydrolase [Permianibacter sp. IMCC34836]|uniref:glycoside hydrolase family 3 protein n=1 Tax=Permianibacter fluminis TaxID=2738515 RepID=UPI0015565FC6|nr:glycoside hydrolase family 3 protein [Permianibacter fluminis]NQD36436.1 exo 1,3/1,4-beta-D-glucan glucohydrolase [Permianibacter fluminis]
MTRSSPARRSHAAPGSSSIRALALVASLLLLQLSACTETEVTAPATTTDSESAQRIHPERWPQQSSPLPVDPALEAKVSALLARMTLEEKVGQIIQADIDSVTPEQVRRYNLGSVLNGGNSAPNKDNRGPAADWLKLADAFWQASTDTSDGGVGIPVMWGTDAVHGQSKIVGATIFPHNIGLGAANDPDLIRRIGAVTAKEIRVTGQDWTFAPTVAVARNDRWGRTYESYSEHPDIVRAYASAMIEGVQGKLGTAEFLNGDHLVATVKHYVGDGGTDNGIDTGNTLSSEDELRDIHAAGYPAAIAAGAQIVMASYSSWQGQKMHGNRALLTDVLIGRMGFSGFVVGDWNGHAHVPGCAETECAAAFNAGLDMFMAPSSWQGLYEATLKEVRSGVISEARLNEAVSRVLRVKYRMGLLSAAKPSERANAGQWQLLGAPEHRAVAREAARKSLVLLKNNQGLLPLRANSKVLITGDGAHNIGKQCGGWTLNWQGTGNRNEHFPHGESIYQGLQQALTAGGGRVELSESGSYQERPDVAIVVFGEDPYAEFQGDRAHLDFADDTALLQLTAFKRAGIPTVAVFLSGRPMWVNPELNQSDAFVAAWLPGTEGGALADVMVRQPGGSLHYDFSGKLSFSWPNDATGKVLNVGDQDYHPLFGYGYGLNYQTTIAVPVLSETSGLSPGTVVNVDRLFTAGKATSPWKLQLLDQGDATLVENPVQVSRHRAVTVQAADRKQQEDTLVIDIKDKAFVSLVHEKGERINWARQSNGDMALEIDYQVIAASGKPVRLGIACGVDCSSYLDVTQEFAASAGKGWRTAEVLLRCFNDPARISGEFRLDRVSAPFVIASEGALTLQIARIRLKPNEGQARCTVN